MKLHLAWISVLLLPAAVFAAGSDLPVPLQTSQGISYYNGGAGLDERARLPQIYSLKLVFATVEGLYLNGADVSIADAAGKEVFSARADNGPWLVADLPAGRYSVKAVIEGQTVSLKNVTVKADAKKTVTLFWKDSTIDLGL